MAPQGWEQGGASRCVPTPAAHLPGTQGQLFGRFSTLKKWRGSNFQSAQCTLNTIPLLLCPWMLVPRLHPQEVLPLTPGAEGPLTCLPGVCSLKRTQSSF